MISFAEELLLLTLDDERGCFCNASSITIDFALAGAVLMELAVKDKIDTDLQNLLLIDKSETGDEVLDTVLSIIAESDEPRNPIFWIREIKNRCINLREVIIERLISKQILRKEEEKFLWVFKHRRYPIINNMEKMEVKTRIREIVLHDLLPEPNDIVLASLISACNLTPSIFTPAELEKAMSRISEIAQMDLISQALSQAINQFMEMITYAVATAT